MTEAKSIAARIRDGHGHDRLPWSSSPAGSGAKEQGAILPRRRYSVEYMKSYNRIFCEVVY